MDEEQYMRLALAEAQAAAEEDEIPVGAVIVKDGAVIAKAHNTNRRAAAPTRHGEINAIEQAAAALGNERLTNCSLYVTKEPCAMCAGAIVHARISRVIIGAADERYGACGTVLSVCGNVALNHKPEIVFGMLKDECTDILRRFFAKKREKQKPAAIF